MSHLTGADVAFDRCGILEAVHSLGSGAYAQYLKLVGTKSTPVADVEAAPEGVPRLEDGAVGPEGSSSAVASLINSFPHVIWCLKVIGVGGLCWVFAAEVVWDSVDLSHPFEV